MILGAYWRPMPFVCRRCCKQRLCRLLHDSMAAFYVHGLQLPPPVVVLQQVEQNPDVCSICLDEFTDEDPSNSTQCG